MAGKNSVFCSRRLSYAMEKLSKNTLIDLVVDRVCAEIGEDVSDERIAAKVQEWLGPVTRARGDKPVSLENQLGIFDGYQRKYMERKQAEEAAQNN